MGNLVRPTPPGKAGMIGFTKTIGKEFAGKGVTANVVPRLYCHDMTDALPDPVKEEATRRIPAKFGTPKRSRMVSFLASDASTSMAEFWPSMVA